MTNIDILILSNGPGEVTTWVRPVVQALRQQMGHDRTHVRISVILSPCPNASGKEAAIAKSYSEVDRVQGPEYFWQFLLWGKTVENWDWRDRGVVVFLGGDQFFPVVIGKRLGYRTVVYAEWEARWYGFIDRFGVMKPEVAARVPQKYAHKFTVVGDLMVEAGRLGGAGGAGGAGGVISFSAQDFSSPTPPLPHSPTPPLPTPPFPTPLIGLLPGSKAAKLMQGVPLLLAIAQHIHARIPQTKFVIPVAPTLDIQTLASFANPQKNPFVETFGNASAKLVESEHPVLQTSTGLSVDLWTRTPAYDLLSQCSICLTTVGANTAELGALAVPMIVLLPTQQLDAMRSWDGLPGILANLPLVGSGFAKLINWLVLRRKGLLAWPNIWAQEMVVPELVGKLQPQEVASIVLDFLAHPEKLDQMRAKLRSIRGEPKAAQRIAQLVSEVMS
ncbi:MAG: lipid-A-disaccharide synthase [Stigonema ocellatum SAG 48.90 = DSM 106950]|nr:lipid-A-disaccharide synthase [Stigonema ocellatum SAG 48.90 = DSM 106950]